MWKNPASVLLVLALLTQNARAAEELRAADEELPPGLELAVDRGLFFLQRQQRSTGAFDAEGPAHAMSGLAILAFLAAGHTPDVGKYGLSVRRAIDWLLDQPERDGYFGDDGGRMYSHCIATVALAEVYGTELDPAQRQKVRSALDKALKIILDAQDVKKDKDSAGGWRYEPKSSDSDLSVSAWCIVGLRACQNAGLVVPRDRAERAVTYILRCYKTEQRGFAYRPGEQASAAMTGAAILCLHLLDAADCAEAAIGAKFLSDKPVREGPYYYYGLYYTTLAAFQSGDRTWAAVWKNTQDQLLPAQMREDGSWPNRGAKEPGGNSKSGRFYSTATACLTLSVPLRLLPIYQR